MASGNFLIGSGSNVDMFLAYILEGLTKEGFNVFEVHQVERAELIVQTDRGYERLPPNTSVLVSLEYSKGDLIRIVHDLDADIHTAASEIGSKGGGEYEWIASKFADPAHIDDDAPVVYLQALSVFTDDNAALDDLPSLLEHFGAEHRHAHRMEYLERAAQIGYIPQD